MAEGNFEPYFGWVKPRVHERASLTDFASLVKDATGAALNTAFLQHYRDAARAHFVVRRLERSFGAAAVRQAASAAQPA